MDAGKKGVIMYDDIRKFYNVLKHPQVRSGLYDWIG